MTAPLAREDTIDGIMPGNYTVSTAQRSTRIALAPGEHRQLTIDF